ncbi:hydrolase 1, exosortase A system-associated [Qipengyuania sp. DSG2-2]|uniref:hydrolase 1, exosortase A system-associated n=1 Tax=Qipengyuania sp. DGS2-2 TaxID=3349631 RepID=UPI0036D32857
MSRLHLAFGCGSSKLAGTLDTAPAKTGLLIVSGGNELRSGAFSGQAHMAARMAKAGFPVFRFDRRGIGDSEGDNRGFEKSKKDIAAALEAFRAITPTMEKVVGLGNCDAASALMLAAGAGCDALVLSNPWTIEQWEDAGESIDLPPDAIRARYLAKLKNPRALWRLVSGGVDLRKLAGGLRGSVGKSATPSGLAERMRHGIADYQGQVHFLLAGNDRTAQAFAASWPKGDERVHRCEGASHAFVEEHARQWFDDQVLAALRSA